MKPRPLPGVNTSLVDVRGRIGRDWAREPGRLGPSRPGRSTAPAPAVPMTVSQSRRDSGSRDKIASREGMHRGYCRRRAGSATAGPAHGLGLSSHTMLFVLDNYDSFTYNLVQLFGELGAEPVVYRNDALTVDQVLALKPTAAVLSPGPCTPGEAGILVPLVNALAGKVPVLGVCLGHQAIGEAVGARVVRAEIGRAHVCTPVTDQSRMPSSSV